VYFYPKVFFDKNDTIGKTLEIIITLEFTSDITYTDDNGDVRPYCVRTKYFTLFDDNNEDLQNYMVQYNTYKQEVNEQTKLVSTLKPQVESLTSQYEGYIANIKRWTE
jgi:hypothetical protein